MPSRFDIGWMFVAGALLPAGMFAMNLSVAMIVLLALVDLSRRGLARPEWPVSMRILFRAWCAYILVLLGSALANGVDTAALRMIKGQLLFLLALPASMILAQADRRRAFCYGLAISLVLFVTYTLFQLYAPRQLPFVLLKRHRFHAAAFENALTWTAVLYLGCSLLIFELERHKLRLQALVLLTLLTLVVVVIGERMYSMVAVAIWAGYLLQGSKRMALLVVCAVGMILVGVWPHIRESNKSQYSWAQLTEGKSAKARKYIWSRAVDMFQQAPVLGVGPGHFGSTLVQMQGSRKPYYYTHAHSNPVHSLAETGLLGFASLMWFQAQWLMAGWHLYRRRALPAALVGLVFVVTGGLTEANWIDSEVVIMSSLLTAVLMAAAGQSAGAEKSTGTPVPRAAA